MMQVNQVVRAQAPGQAQNRRHVVVQGPVLGTANRAREEVANLLNQWNLALGSLQVLGAAACLLHVCHRCITDPRALEDASVWIALACGLFGGLRGMYRMHNAAP